MSGTAIVRYLLAHSAGLIAVVPATKIAAGALPINTTLPAISITEISGVPHLFVADESEKLITERVQVDVLATGYLQQKTIAALIRAALPRSNGTVNGIDCESILPEMEGPDMFTDNPVIYSQSQDFIVKFHR